MPESLDEVFPSVPRVMYERSPLVQVICQVRYPAILRIDTALPADFQDRVREAYPIFEQSRQSMLTGIPKELANLVPPHSFDDRHIFKFSSEDGEWTLNLSQDSISLTATNYNRWEDFRRQMLSPLAALVDTYSPNFYTRIGLRYTDRIRRSKLDLERVEWSELIEPHILGELHLPQMAALALESAGRLRMRLPNVPDKVLLQHGLNVAEGEDELAYFIDFDFYVDQKTEVTDAPMVLDRLNRHAGQAFRWCIQDRLHDALRPSPVGEQARETA